MSESIMPQDFSEPKSPMTCKVIRIMQRIYEKASNITLRRKLFTSQQHLTAQRSIDQHLLKGTRNALQNAKKRDVRGKPLTLLNEEASGVQFYGSEKMKKARAIQSGIATEKAQEREAIDGRKAVRAANKVVRDAALKERRILAAKEEGEYRKASPPSGKTSRQKTKKATNKHHILILKVAGLSLGPSEPEGPPQRQGGTSGG